MTELIRPARGLLASLLLATALPLPALSQVVTVDQQNPRLRVEQIISGLGVPWGMAFLGPTRLLITERSGSLRLLDLETFSLRRVAGVPAVVAEGQGGLLDVAIGPAGGGEGWIYFTYSKAADSEATTALARARLDGERLVDWQDLLITDAATGTRRHFGSRIAFDDDGHVYFGVGDRGVRENAQNTANHAGSIIRLDLDGSVPDDNPFVGDAKLRDEIWSFGHRNPQGLLFDSPTQRLWEIEHGPRGGDEINLILKGRNYGWPVVSHGKEYWGPFAVGEATSKPGMEDPRKVYIPSIAPGSLLLYRGEAFPDWRGDLFAGALKLQHLNRISLSADGRAIAEERLLEDLGERIRALAESPEGWIYFSTDSGRILRLRPD
ncbi:MAG TPA: PQQ-dependent sugar dehydrogenase [Gammaproteobacteria bacterium]|nr:PQQ-dependent sugar dehydrogenase [Gammaproteobacteria bacterium]